MKKHSILLVCLCLILFNCQNKAEDSDSTGDSEIAEAKSSVTNIFSDGNEYFPIEPGTSWTYGYTGEMSGRTYSMEITDEEHEQNGETYMVIKQVTNGEEKEISLDLTMYVRVEDGNVYSFMPKVMEKEALAIPNDVSEGKTWEVPETGKFTVLSMNKSIETPTKSYDDCLVLETDLGGGSKTVSYYVKGIGSVATEIDGKLIVYLMKFED